MARCAACGNRIGVFGRSWRKLRGEKYCWECSSKYISNRNLKAKETILSFPDHVVFLAVPVISRDPDDYSNLRRYAGVLLLSNKGVILAAHYEYKQGDVMLGIAGAIAVAPVDVSIKGSREINRVLSELGKIDVSNPMELVEKSEHLFFFGLDDIKSMKANGMDCKLKLPNGKAAFRWQNPRKYLTPHRELLDTYVRTVNSRGDIMMNCKPFMRI